MTIGYGVLGFVDDYPKVRRAPQRGHHGAHEALLAVRRSRFGVAWLIYTDPGFDKELAVPFFKDFTPNLGLLLRARSPPS